MISKEFFKQLSVIADEKGIDVKQLEDAFALALAKAYNKAYGNSSVKVVMNSDKCEILVYSLKQVVSELSTEEVDSKEEKIEEITLEEARQINSKYNIGDVIEKQVNPKDFGRLAAATAKSVFNQSIKSIQKDNAYNYFKKCENETIVAKIIEIKDNYVTLSIGQDVTTLLPQREILSNDDFKVGDDIKVYIVSVENTSKGPKVFVSRSDKNLVTRLMEDTIPEIKEGTIEIMGIARDPGDRTKIAIYSKDENVDAIGSCVGANGNRIKDVVRQLNGEKVDLYKWSPDVKTMIANSLQPASVLAVINVNNKEKTSLAIVPDDQLSLAIGKQGQNVRLAVQSCGWKIDIKCESEAKEEGIEF